MAGAALQAACPPPPAPQAAEVAAVVDGDTLRLADGRSLRLIGINTPELGRDGRPDQPLAREARRAVMEQLPADRRIYLQPGRDDRDRHGRLLASVFLRPDGGHLGEHLLAQGLGWQVVVPPNTRYRDCLSAAETRAREASRGVWALDHYRARPVDSLRPGESGFLRLSGVVTEVADSRRALWLELGPRLSLRVPKDRLAYFDDVPSNAWAGRRLTVRGWVIYRGEDRRGHPPHMMNLHHPGMIEVPVDPRSP